MENNFIQFKKEREMGEILSDTFRFIRYNFKSLFETIVRFTGIPFLVLIFAIGYYTYTTLSSGFNIFSMVDGGTMSESASGHLGDFFLGFIFMMVALMLYYAMLFGSINYFIKSYMAHQGKANLEEVGHGVSEDWSTFIGLGFVTSVITFVASLFCVIPGIYVAVPLSLVYSIKVFDRLSLSEAISYSFSLVKDNWWVTFFTLFVMFILFYLISLIFQLPAGIYSLVKIMTASQNGTLSDPSSFIDWIYLALSLIASIIQYILYSIIVISTVFVYFNLNERKNHTGAYEEIDNLGNQNL